MPDWNTSGPRGPFAVVDSGALTGMARAIIGEAKLDGLDLGHARAINAVSKALGFRDPNGLTAVTKRGALLVTVPSCHPDASAASLARLARLALAPGAPVTSVAVHEALRAASAAVVEALRLSRSPAVADGFSKLPVVSVPEAEAAARLGAFCRAKEVPVDEAAESRLWHSALMSIDADLDRDAFLSAARALARAVPGGKPCLEALALAVLSHPPGATARAATALCAPGSIPLYLARRLSGAPSWPDLEAALAAVPGRLLASVSAGGEEVSPDEMDLIEAGLTDAMGKPTRVRGHISDTDDFESWLARCLASLTPARPLSVILPSGGGAPLAWVLGEGDVDLAAIGLELELEAPTRAPGFPDRPPSVPVDESVQPDHLVCLEDGRKMKMLTRYLRNAYGMTPDEYRERWGLPGNYPMVAPSYSAMKVKYAARIAGGDTGRQIPDWVLKAIAERGSLPRRTFPRRRAVR